MMIQEKLVDDVDTAIYTAAVEAFDAYTGTFPPEVGSVVQDVTLALERSTF